MSGTYPSTPGFRSTAPRSINRNYKSESQSGRVQVRNRGGQQWAFTLRYNPISRSRFAPVDAFVTDQDGQLETFQIVLPVLSDSSGDPSGTMRANGSASVGATSLSVDGFTGTLKAGDFFKFASHSKVYKATADRNGSGSLSFKPSLKSAVADNEIITYSDVPFTVRLANDLQEFSTGADQLFRYEVDMIEAI